MSQWFPPEAVYETIYKDERSKDLERFLKLAEAEFDATIQSVIERTMQNFWDQADGDEIWLELDPLRIEHGTMPAQTDEDGEPLSDGRGLGAQFYGKRFTESFYPAIAKAFPKAHAQLLVDEYDRFEKRGELVCMVLIQLALGDYPIFDREAASAYWHSARQVPQSTMQGQMALFV